MDNEVNTECMLISCQNHNYRTSDRHRVTCSHRWFMAFKCLNGINNNAITTPSSSIIPIKMIILWTCLCVCIYTYMKWNNGEKLLSNGYGEIDFRLLPTKYYVYNWTWENSVHSNNFENKVEYKISKPPPSIWHKLTGSPALAVA